MLYAILAAGEGSRLAQEGCEVPKPLVSIQGETLIGRLIRVFVANGAQRIVVICNAQHRDTREYLASLTLPVPLDVVVQSTPSSMHSLYAIRDYLAAEERFCVTTVDTIFSEREFAAYIRAFRMNDFDGCPPENDRFRTLVSAAPVVAVLSGHLHFQCVSELANGVVQYGVSQGITGNVHLYTIGE